MRKEKRVGNPFVTISYELGACGRSVVENLGEYLQKNENRKEYQWRVFDKNLLQKVVEEHNLPEKVLPYLSESTVSDLEDSLEMTFGVHPSRHYLVYKMNQTIQRLSLSGYVIIVGRGANIVTAKLPKGVHVRLIGSLDKRIRYIQEHLKMEKKEAKDFIVQESRSRAKYFRKYFDKDINNPLLYDVIINTDRRSIQDIVREIGNLVLKGN